MSAVFPSGPAYGYGINAPPKPETDCGVTAMCLTPTAPARHDGVPLWTVEVVMLAVVLVVVAVGYRLLLSGRLFTFRR